MFIDLGAERFLGAEKDGRRIAVEVKSFAGSSEVRELEVALGQFVLYGDALAIVEGAVRCRARGGELVKAGIPRSRIVLGFWDLEARKLGDFAAALVTCAQPSARACSRRFKR